MSERRADRRRNDRRAFRPTLDAKLETRVVMSRFGKFGYLYPAGHIQTAFGGQAVDITTNTGESFYIFVDTGQVRAFAMPGGKFGLRVSGTTPNSTLTINPVVDSQIVHTAHKVNGRQTQYTGTINLGMIDIMNGQINDILGYKTAVLSGPLYAFGTNPIDRIALDSIQPGGSIITGGDVNTLDIATNVILSGAGNDINIGRDLNFFSTFGDVDVINGANIIIGRNLGLTAQPAKGTGPSSIPANTAFLASTSTVTTFSNFEATQIEGNLVIAPGSQFLIRGAIGGQFFISGFVAGANNISTQGLLNTQLNHGSIYWIGNGILYSFPRAGPATPTPHPDHLLKRPSGWNGRSSLAMSSG